MSMVDAFIAEMEQESKTTHRFLDRIPGDRLDWKPHEKSLTVGQLGMHIATSPGMIAGMAAQDECQMPDFAEGFPHPSNSGEIVAAHTDGVRDAIGILKKFSDADLAKDWKVIAGGHEMMNMPRVAFLRSILMNHTYHHRGQLGVYLRLLGVDVPYAYGPSADEVPPEMEAMREMMAK